jgi:membrane protease subunit (stomatin/prohibitin family)
MKARSQYQAIPLWEGFMLSEMFDQAVQAGEAQRESAARGMGSLIPALMGCANCGTVEMIAAPALGICPDCGAGLSVLSADQI